MKIKLMSVFFLILSVTLSGCGYKLGTIPVGGIKTIAIAAVDNQTGKSFIEEATVTNTVIQQFNKDGTVKVTEEAFADAVILITLTNYNQSAQAFTEKDVGEYFRLIITAEILVKDKKGQTLHTETIQGEGKYSVTQDQGEIERIAVKEAIKDLCIDTVRSVVEGGF